MEKRMGQDIETINALIEENRLLTVKTKHLEESVDCAWKSTRAIDRSRMDLEDSIKGNIFKLGDRVKKKSGSEWSGVIVGTYSTKLTPEGYAVESEAHAGSVQIYPVGALEKL